MPYPNVWYCSECGDGPIGLANNPQCPICQHTRCSSCKVGVAESRDTTSLFEDSASECSDYACKTPFASKTIPPLAYGCDPGIALHPTEAFRHMPGPGSAISSLRQNIIPLTHAALAAHDHGLRLSTTPLQDSNGPEDGGTTYIWYCCACGEGPNSYEYAPACTSCGTSRCAGCSVQVTTTPK